MFGDKLGGPPRRSPAAGEGNAIRPARRIFADGRRWTGGMGGDKDRVRQVRRPWRWPWQGRPSRNWSAALTAADGEQLSRLGVGHRPVCEGGPRGILSCSRAYRPGWVLSARPAALIEEGGASWHEEADDRGVCQVLHHARDSTWRGCRCSRISPAHLLVRDCVFPCRTLADQRKRRFLRTRPWDWRRWH